MNAPGPVHIYVAPGTKVAVKLMLPPVHTGELFAAVGVAGIELTVTDTVPGIEVQPAAVATTLYIPLAPTGALGTTGFCKEELKPEGPLH